MRYLIRWYLGEIIPAKRKGSQRKDTEHVLWTLGSQLWLEWNKWGKEQSGDGVRLYWGWMTLRGRVDACKLLGSYSEWNWKLQQVSEKTDLVWLMVLWLFNSILFKSRMTLIIPAVGVLRNERRKDKLRRHCCPWRAPHLVGKCGQSSHSFKTDDGKSFSRCVN